MNEHDREDSVAADSQSLADSANENNTLQDTTQPESIAAIEAPMETVIEEKTIADTEIEPSTQAYSVQNTQTPRQEQVLSPLSSEPSQDVAMPALQHPKSSSKKRLYGIAAACTLVVLVAGLSFWWVMSDQNKTVVNSTEDTSSSATRQARLGVAITVADGMIEQEQDGVWQTIAANAQLQEGDQIRTGEGSRAVLTLDDGSAVRLDAQTAIELESLVVDDVKIKQLSGVVYSRVVASDRAYTVVAADTTYQALGTAFVTMNSEATKGVQVYHSSVQVGGQDESVSEGKQYFTANANTTLTEKITDIDLDSLTDDSFVNWNLSQDESDANFKDKLGSLSRIKELKNQKEQAQKAEEARKAEELQQEEKEKSSHSNGEKVTRGAMSLSLSGTTFSWTHGGKASYGYKLVYSKTDNPTFPTDSAVYFDSINQMSGSLPKKNDKKTPLSGRYYVRVCAYTNTTESDPCVDYSNIVTIDL